VTTSIPDFDFNTNKIEVLEDTSLGGGLKILVLKLAKESILPYNASKNATLMQRTKNGRYNPITRKFEVQSGGKRGVIDLTDYGIATNGVFYANAMLKGRDTVDGVPIQYPFTGTFHDHNPGVNPQADSVWSVVRNIAFKSKGRNSTEGLDHHYQLAPLIRNVIVQNAGDYQAQPSRGGPGGSQPEDAMVMNCKISISLSMASLMGGADTADYSIGRITGGSHSVGSTSNITIEASGNANLQKFANTGDYAITLDSTIERNIAIVGQITVVNGNTFNVADGIGVQLDVNSSIGIVPKGFFENCESVILTVIGRQG
jgi:hypothetical protein